MSVIVYILKNRLRPSNKLSILFKFYKYWFCKHYYSHKTDLKLVSVTFKDKFINAGYFKINDRYILVLRQTLVLIPALMKQMFINSVVLSLTVLLLCSTGLDHLVLLLARKICSESLHSLQYHLDLLLPSKIQLTY